ncbi:phosphatidylinositol 4,5-bisphosphate 3-kinase catalytic subunit delta isoform-like [Babylonia areolata]|uniref:phosphatidylinositol 4,5-bisphosphate 3-kinase catalytic subunit delta isoform-like n=1 Tax=Babylonia areolata TaxID=304850 RepID=UPI003FD46F07
MSTVQLPDISVELDATGHLSVDFLMPSGILVPLLVDFYASLDLIKKSLWREVVKYPLCARLKREDSYCFMFVNKLGEKEEILDESQNLNDVRPFWPVLKLVEKRGDKTSKTIDRRVNNLIGKGPHKLDSFQPAEIEHFRRKMNDLCHQINTTRRGQTAMEKFQWRHPLRLRNSAQVPRQLESRLNNNQIVIDVNVQHSGVSEGQVCTHLKLGANAFPVEVVRLLLAKRPEIGRNEDDYILKVYGLNDFIYGDYPLIQFKYVYQCLVKNTAPQMWLIAKDTLADIAPPVPERPRQGATELSASERNNAHCSWKVQQYFTITVTGLSKVQLADASKLKLFCGLYHGNEALCEVQETEELTVLDGCCNVKVDLTFPLVVADVPRSARLCFTVCPATNIKKKNARDFNPIVWVNMPVYDFKGRLPRGDQVLPLWQFDTLMIDEPCYPLGTVALNPLGHDATTLSLSFSDYNVRSSIVYPPYHLVKECAAEHMEQEGTPGSPGMAVSSHQLDQLQAMLQQEELFEQDKEQLWMLRYEARDRFSQHLPHLLQAVKWNNHVDVAKMTILLESWPQLGVDYALELLDFDYPDYSVRKFAVRCLNESLGDDELSQYMLQLVQALKYETYLNCPLAKFLLTRALKNQHLGHKFFWLLRSEMHVPGVMVQYSLILECYLRANSQHLEELDRQKEALEKLTFVNGLVKMDRYKLEDQKSRELANKDMQSVLGQKSYFPKFSDLTSPLSPLFHLKELKVPKCRVMKSKKRPLWLVWSNTDSVGPDIYLLYKNGDDLRQDMLTLQILQLMDNIWQAEGLDLRMNPYMCIATGDQQGLIEVVTESDTIANIQMWYRRNTFDKRALLEWLKSKHGTGPELDQAVQEFMLSCAGYCVATYVLGIGDRHNDNIMMKSSGQLFHIDFGHFLGNTKSKFGVKRDRVPFVLTTHFVHVIKKGESNNDNFQRFQDTCEQAYLILRSRYHLLMSLFMMMLSSGIPQLTCPRDVDYLKETLRPELSESEAREHFRGKFREAKRNSWTTSINFWFHNFVRD